MEMDFIREESIVTPRFKVGDDEIQVRDQIDLIENGQRSRYILAEVFVYFFIPFIVMGLLTFVIPQLYAGIIGGVIFAWPVFKGFVAKIIAGKNRDPRLFLRSSSFWYDGFLFVGSKALMEIRKYSALSRSLDVIYNHFERFGIKPKYFSDENWLPKIPIVRFLIRRWTDFWIGMPIAQDVRSRLAEISDQYYWEILRLTTLHPGKKIQILEIAGGSLQAVVMAISRAIEDDLDFDYKVVSIEPNEFSNQRAQDLINHFGLDSSKFIFLKSRISTNGDKKEISIRNLLKKTGIKRNEFDLVVCIGLGDYYYTPKRIRTLLDHLNYPGKVIVANISDNVMERYFLHYFIQWPSMKYRSLSEWKGILLDVFVGRQISVIQTPHKIFNIAVIEKR